MLKLGPHRLLSDSERAAVLSEGRMGRTDGFRVAGEMPQNLPALVGKSMASGISGMNVAELVKSLTNTSLVSVVGTGMGTPQQ